MGKDLTVRYSVTQFFYSAVYSASGIFATTYLLGISVDAMLLSGIGVAFLGTAILLLTLKKTDI